MNERGVSSKGYDNSRREEQATENRGRILDAALELLKSDSALLTIPAVAKQAGVSVPTVYRNFSSKDELLVAVEQHASQLLGAPALPSSVDQLSRALPALHDYYARNFELMRATERLANVAEVNRVGKRRRDQRFVELLAADVAHLPKDQQRAFTAVLRLMLSSATAISMFDRYGIDADSSSATLAWIVDTLLASLRSERARGTRALGPKARTAKPK